MLEYDIDEAQALLEKNLSTATRNLETLENDLDFLRDQFTTTEVSILALLFSTTSQGTSKWQSCSMQVIKDQKKKNWTRISHIFYFFFFTFFVISQMEFPQLDTCGSHRSQCNVWPYSVYSGKTKDAEIENN